MFPAGVPGIRVRRVAVPGGMSLRVVESGTPASRPLLLIHGWGASVYMWRDWFTPLAAAGFRPVAVDLPSHGLSDAPAEDAGYRVERLADAVRAVIDALGLESPDVVAQSMGGTIALELALEDPSRVGRLALVNPACFGRIGLQRLARSVSPPAVDRVLPRLLGRWIVARAHRLVYGDPSRITERDIDEYWAPSQFPGYSQGMRRLIHEFRWDRPPVEEMAARLARLKHPALVVLGTSDRLVRHARGYVASLARAGAPLVVHEVAEGGHAVNEERPAEVAALTLEFLRR